MGLMQYGSALKIQPKSEIAPNHYNLIDIDIPILMQNKWAAKMCVHFWLWLKWSEHFVTIHKLMEKCREHQFGIGMVTNMNCDTCND